MAEWYEAFPEAPQPPRRPPEFSQPQQKQWYEAYPEAHPPPKGGGYVGESIGALKSGAREAYEGAKETGSEAWSRYKEAASQHPGMAGPIYGIGNALLGLPESPAGELAQSALLGSGGVERMAPESLRLANEPVDIRRPVPRGEEPVQRPSGEAPPVARPGASEGRQVSSPGAKAPPPGLVVARKLPDRTVQYGKPGEVHYHLLGDPDNDPRFMEKFNKLDMDTLGFAEPGGPFMSRKEASDWVAKNEPSVKQLNPYGRGLEGGTYIGPYEPKTLGAASTTQKTDARIETGTGIWGAPTAGRNLLRQQRGIMEQKTARQNLAFEQHRRLSNQMTPQESIDTIRYMQHRSTDGPLGPIKVDPKFQAMTDEIRQGYIAREAELKSLDEFERMQFEEDHFTQKWQDPRKAKDVWDGWRGKEGTTGFTKHKKYLDFDAGLAAGLKPKSYNIIDVAMNDFANQDRVIEMARTREKAEDQGYIKWAQNSRQVPSDWVPLTGYGAERGFTRAYAPADFARNYNNFVGRGFGDTPLAGTMQGLRAMTNGLTQLELGLSAYHVSTIAGESIRTGVADTVYAMTHGHPWQAAKNLGKTLASPVYYAAKGRKAGQIYLGQTPGSQIESRAVEALVQANAHLGPLEPALLSGRTRSLITQFNRGAIPKDIANSFRTIREADGFFRTIGTTAIEAGRAVGEVLNTISAPLFQQYIPAVKRGMMMDQMAQWLKTHPSAEWNEIVTQAQEISDIADERFGEMKQDNLFWNPMIKQSAQVAMRSTSWAYGSWTQYAGGVKELGSIPSKGIGRRTSYLFADAFTTALIGGMTTYLMTGKRPNDWHDFIWGKTGGTTTVHAGKRTYKVDERVNLPGSIKEIVGVTAAVMDVKDYGSLAGFAEYARNKENDFIKTMGELVTNQDWRGAPLINPFSKESTLKQWFNVGMEAFGPISLKQEEPDKGSRLNFPGSAFLGFRPAGRRWIDPKGYRESVDARLQRAAKENESYQKRRAADRPPRVRHEYSQ